MASAQELSDFLSSIEQRAFKQAVYAVRDDDAALDIVQDAMIKLAQSYGDKPVQELPLLFTRIVQNTTKDWFRRQKIRNTWVSFFSSFKRSDSEEEADPEEFFANDESKSYGIEGSNQLERQELTEILENEINNSRNKLHSQINIVM